MNLSACARALAVAGALLPLGAACAPLAGGVLSSALQSTGPLAPLFPPERRYRPAAPQPATGPVQIRSVRFPSSPTWDPLELELEALPDPATKDGVPARRSLRRAWVSVPAAPACAAGWMAEGMRVAGQERWDRPLPLGAGLELNFLVPRPHLREPLVLDLLVEDEVGQSGCERLALGSADDAGMLPESRVSGGGGFGLVLARPGRDDATLGEVGTYGVLAAGSLGYWLGRWRLGGRIEACFGGCGGGSFYTLPVLATADWLFYAGDTISTAVTAGYEVGRIEDAINAADGRGTWAHGPRLALLVLGSSPFAGANPKHGFAARGMEVFVMRQFLTVGRTDRPTPSWLLGLLVLSL